MKWKPILRTAGIALGVLLLGAVVTLVLYLRVPWIRTESVTFRNGDVTLAGTLMLPRWQKPPYPAVVIVQGSASSPRWLYWLYGRHLTQFGMAALIYDKRGVGASSGTSPQELLMGKTNYRDIGNPKAPRAKVNVAACGEMIDILAGDVLAGVAAMKARADIDTRRLGLLGVSQAGWIMPLAASRSPDVAFIVSISGPPMTCGQQVRYTEWTGIMPGFTDLGLSDEEVARRLREDEGPVGYDPMPVLETLRIPTLWLMGGRDRMVPTPWSEAAVRRLVADHGAPFDLRIYPEGEHGLMRVGIWPDVRSWLAARGVLPGDH